MDDYRGKLRYPVTDELMCGGIPALYSRITRETKIVDPFWDDYKPILRDSKRARRIRDRLLRRR